jgi:hypothetical protein
MFYLRITDEPEITGVLSTDRNLLHEVALLLRGGYDIGSSVSNTPKPGFSYRHSCLPKEQIASDLALSLRSLRSMEADEREANALEPDYVAIITRNEQAARERVWTTPDGVRFEKAYGTRTIGWFVDQVVDPNQFMVCVGYAPQGYGPGHIEDVTPGVQYKLGWGTKPMYATAPAWATHMITHSNNCD